MGNKVTRFELIDGTGRVYLAYPNSVDVSYQDDGRTMKVFVNGQSVAHREAHASELEVSLRAARQRKDDGF